MSDDGTERINRRTTMNYLKAVVGSCMGVIAFKLIISLVSNRPFLPQGLKEILGLFVWITTATAMFGKKPIPEIWTTGNDTKEEKYNNRLFKCISVLGIGLSIVLSTVNSQSHGGNENSQKSYLELSPEEFRPSSGSGVILVNCIETGATYSAPDCSFSTSLT